MKILHLNTERTWRGGEQQTLYLHQALWGRGISSQLVCPPESPLARRAREAGLPVFEVGMRGEVDFGACRGLRRLIVQNGCDLLHAHTSHALSLAFWSSLGLPVRRLVTPTGGERLSPPNDEEVVVTRERYDELLENERRGLALMGIQG
jgi:hypothetical protein